MRMSRPISLASATVLLALAASPAGSQPADDGRAFSATFDTVSIDLRQDRSIYTNVRITDGEVTISAAEGTTSESSFEDGEWTLSGGVRVVYESAELTADSATFVVEQGELLHGELIGAPVLIRDYIEERSAEVVGTAEIIRIDKTEETASLLGEATLSVDTNEYSGCDMVYRLVERTFSSGSAECGVTLVLFPEEDSADATSSEPGQ